MAAQKASAKKSIHRKVEKSKKGYRKHDAHKEIYNKEYHEVKYSEEHRCPVCCSRIDENGMCACGAGGS